MTQLVFPPLPLGEGAGCSRLATLQNPRASGNPAASNSLAFGWIPACAGMTDTVSRSSRELAAFAAQKSLVVGSELAELGALHHLGALHPGALALGEGLLARGGRN